MDEQVIRFRVGAVVVAGGIITIVMAMFFGAWQKVKPHYRINLLFPEAPGIKVDTPVRKGGLLIGRVSEIRFYEEGQREDQKGWILMSVAIDREFKLRNRETCRIAPSSLFGDAVLEFVPFTNEQLLVKFDANKNGRLDPDELERANELISDTTLLDDGEVANNPARLMVNLEKNVQETLASVQSAGEQVRELAKTVNKTIGENEGDFRELVEKTKKTLDAMNKVLGDEKLLESVRKSLDAVPKLVDKTDETLKLTSAAMADFKTASQRVTERLDDLKPLTESLRVDGDDIVKKLKSSSDELDTFLKLLVGFGKRLNSDESTLGKLVADDELYLKIEQVVSNVEESTRLLRPILQDVRVFVDKIARDPRQLGVSGALDRRPSGSGLKTLVPFSGDGLR